jgi:hypothetical protein
MCGYREANMTQFSARLWNCGAGIKALTLVSHFPIIAIRFDL